jgi:hypothetical protein
MKLMYLVLLVFFVNVALMVTGVSTGAVNNIFNFLSNPTDWNNSPWSGFIGFVLAAAGIGIIVGAMVFRNENLLWYGVAAAFFSFGTPLVDLFNYVKTGVGGDMGSLIATVMVSPIILAYMFIIIYWARGRD